MKLYQLCYGERDLANDLKASEVLEYMLAPNRPFVSLEQAMKEGFEDAKASLEDETEELEKLAWKEIVGADGNRWWQLRYWDDAAEYRIYEIEPIGEQP